MTLTPRVAHWPLSTTERLAPVIGWISLINNVSDLNTWIVYFFLFMAPSHVFNPTQCFTENCSTYSLQTMLTLSVVKFKKKKVTVHILVEKGDWRSLWQQKLPCQKRNVSWHSKQIFQFSSSDMSGNKQKKKGVKFGRWSADMQRTCGCKDKDVTNGAMLTCVILTLWFMLWYFFMPTFPNKSWHYAGQSDGKTLENGYLHDRACSHGTQ